MKINIGGILDISTVDYPGKVSSVVFFCGCNFRCPFCYNVSLVRGEACEEVEVEEVVKKIKGFKEFIDSVTITGGEPTLQEEGLKELCIGLKNMKLLVKLDTNGYRPEVLKELVNLVDFVSLDVKAPPDKYNFLSGIECELQKIKKSIEILKNSEIDYELRTTVVPGVNDSVDDIKKLCEFIGKVKCYVLQQFRPEGGTLDPKFSETEKMDRNRLWELAKVAKSFGLNVKIRTEEDGERVVE